MSHLVRLLSLFVALAALVGPAAAQAQNELLIAWWRFESPDTFLLDSSPNGHTLINGNGGNAAVFSAEVMPVADSGTGSALFDGDAVLRTANTLDLSGFQRLRIRWIQRLTAPQGFRLVFVNTTQDFTSTAGAFYAGVHSNLVGTPDPATQGLVALTGQPGRFSDLFPHNVGNPPGVWERFRADIRRVPNAGGDATIIQVFNGSTGVEIGTDFNAAPTSLPGLFLNDFFSIGARDQVGTFGFSGNIDELSISSFTEIPQPGPGPTPDPGPAGPGTAGPGAVPGPTVVVGPGVSGANGVLVDAKGVLKLRDFPHDELLKKRISAARAKLNPQVAKASKLRKVSLNRLEEAIQAGLRKGQLPTEEMNVLAGLTRLRYVFYYPETKDIVLAGPAEGWMTDVQGRRCGILSGRPMLQLQDLVVALRAFAPGKPRTPVILVSIDPTPEGLASMQDFLKKVGTQIEPEDTEMIVNGLRTSLGMQNIRVGGISPNTHFAQVLLECDYRMKLIGIGLETPPVDIVSFVDRASPSRNRNALQRWYFIPDNQSVRISPDHMGLELVGDGVKLVAEDQVVAQDGNRSATGKKNTASDQFTRSFTLKYPELAARVPAFAEMRNVIDLAIAAAFIHKEDFYAQSGWQAATLNSARHLNVESGKTPKQVETVVAAVWKGSRLFTPVGGGVTIRPQDPLQAAKSLPDNDGKITELRESIDLKDLPEGRWWWD
jgi:hypothetical protein